MKHPLALKLFLLVNVPYSLMSLILSINTLPTFQPAFTSLTLWWFWASVSFVVVLFAYAIIWYGLWFGNRPAYAIAWILEIGPLLLGIRHFYYLFNVSVAIVDTLIECLLLGLSYKHFFRGK